MYEDLETRMPHIQGCVAPRQGSAGDEIHEAVVAYFISSDGVRSMSLSISTA